MTEENRSPAEDIQIPPRKSEWRRFSKVFFSRGVVIFGMVVIAIVIFAAVFAPWVAPYNPYQPDLNSVLQQPSRAHLLGTDALGRDTFSRIIYGTRTSLMIGLVAVGIAAFIGMTMGLIAGYFGGWIYAVIMRFIDAMMSFPLILLALIIAAMLGGGLRNIMIALGIGLIPAYARLMCGQVLSVKENDYVLAGRAMGSGNMRIMFRHVVPNCFPPLIVLITMMMGLTILAEAGLSFLGIGIEPPGAAWGAMVNDGYQYLLTHPILSFAPGLAIMLVVFSFNMVGDGLRDALDPRLRGVL
ncbi:MAG: ABC transporter permease [Deltaproteobacteria bacterium]|nr:ABC transporter permease [Deltaproteobacteria bacterium]